MKLSLRNNKPFFNNCAILFSVRYGCLNLIVVLQTLANNDFYQKENNIEFIYH